MEIDVGQPPILWEADAGDAGRRSLPLSGPQSLVSQPVPKMDWISNRTATRKMLIHASKPLRWGDDAWKESCLLAAPTSISAPKRARPPTHRPGGRRTFWKHYFMGGGTLHNLSQQRPLVSGGVSMQKKHAARWFGARSGHVRAGAAGTGNLVGTFQTRVSVPKPSHAQAHLLCWGWLDGWSAPETWRQPPAGREWDFQGRSADGWGLWLAGWLVAFVCLCGVFCISAFLPLCVLRSTASSLPCSYPPPQSKQAGGFCIEMLLPPHHHQSTFLAGLPQQGCGPE